MPLRKPCPFLTVLKTENFSVDSKFAQSKDCDRTVPYMFWIKAKKTCISLFTPVFTILPIKVGYKGYTLQGHAIRMRIPHNITIKVIVRRLFEEKRRDIVFGFPSFRPSVLPSPYRSMYLVCATPPTVLFRLF